MRYQQLATFHAERGHSNVPSKSKTLYAWALQMRKAYKKGQLSQERIQALEALGFKWHSQGPEQKPSPGQGD